MDLLLDTHAAIWWLADDPALTSTQRQVITDKRNSLFVSSASIWEISIKRSLGKIEIDTGYTDVLRAQGFIELPISWIHAREVNLLPMHHRDPFDRLLVAQARIESMVLVTSDPEIPRYDLRTVS